MAMAPAVESTFDVAGWFYDRALNDREYLQPQKLQRLLYLSQAYYAVANNSRMLFPSIIVASEFGPMVYDVYRAFEYGRPSTLETKPPVISVKDFLDSLWRRFGPHTTEHLNKMVNGHKPYVDAFKAMPGSEITIAAMVEFYSQLNKKKENSAPGITDVLRPKVMRSQTGKPVSVQKWMPHLKKNPEKQNGG